MLFSVKGKQIEKVDTTSFAAIGLKESDMEEYIRENIEMLWGEEESLLVVGQQVKDEQHKRSDLTAIDNDGNMVLIEIKRDKKDINNRKEAFEFQAIRYAASYATIKTIDELVTKIYAPYIEKYRNENLMGELTAYELGIRKLNEFLDVNKAAEHFNEKQRIILIASEFNDQTLSAVAWLNKNNVDISCFQMLPTIIHNEIYIDVKKILPLENYNDYYVDILEISPKVDSEKRFTRRSLPKIDSMLKWGVVKPGDIIMPKNRTDEAILLKNGNVEVKGKEISLQTWLKEIYGWSSVETYAFSIHKETGKTLSEIRRDYMNKQLNEGK